MNVTYNFREFQGALKRMSHAASTDEKRPTLQCVHVLGTKWNTKLTAADGFRLAMVKTAPAQNAQAFDILLDPSTVKALVSFKIGKKQDPELTLDMDNNHAMVDGRGVGGFSENGRGNGQFPDVSVVIPKKSSTSFSVFPLPLLQALKTARVFSREGSNVVQLHVGESLVIASNSEGVGTSRAVVSVYKKTGPDLLIAFNVDFLIDILKQAGTESVKFEFNKPTTPALITARDDFQAVIMPMSLSSTGGGVEFLRPEDIPVFMDPMPMSFVWPGSTPTPYHTEWVNDRLNGKHGAPVEMECNGTPFFSDDIFTSTPEPGAVEYDLTGAVYTMEVTTPKYGKEIRTPAITLELTNPRPVEIPTPTTEASAEDWQTVASTLVDEMESYVPAPELESVANELGVPADVVAALFGASPAPSRYALEEDEITPESTPAPAPVEFVYPSRYALMDDD